MFEFRALVPGHRLVREWAHLRLQESVVSWDRALRHEDPGTIQPLE